MKTHNIKKIMVPLSEYATVSEDASLMDAIKALENSQKAFDQNRYKHRAILVFDKYQHVIGKISQHDVIKSLEPHYEKIEKEEHKAWAHYGLSGAFVESALNTYRLWDKPLENLCKKAVLLKAKQIMYKTTENEFVSEDATLDEAIHRLITEGHHSLLVTSCENREIVGVLRLTDVFELVVNVLKEC